MRRLLRLRNWLLMKLAGSSPIMINCTVRAPLMGPAESQRGGLYVHNLAIGDGFSYADAHKMTASFFAYKGVSTLDWIKEHPEFAGARSLSIERQSKEILDWFEQAERQTLTHPKLDA